MAPTTPLPASTVVLVRPDSKGSFEVYLNRRPDRMDTYAGVYVFPGGRVEKCDYSADMLTLTRGVTPIGAQTRLGSELPPQVCLAHWVAAVRELFEEAGIHFFSLSTLATAEPLANDLCGRLADKRPSLQRGDITLADLLSSEGLFCNLEPLIYFFHRITPEHYPVRFDTRFYLAALPPNQTPLHASEEVSESLWIAPKLALIRAESGEYRMMPPTLAVLRTLTMHPSWKDLQDAFNLA
jgi:8-oxo-dGTP pyrophosphatase MutT (NUDIX family)